MPDYVPLEAEVGYYDQYIGTNFVEETDELINIRVRFDDKGPTASGSPCGGNELRNISFLPILYCVD